jgi:N-acetylglucosamine kinase-like BadF-type ATPase
VVCGAGSNCVGVGPDGREARFPALGPVSGDWGGGWDLGMAALAAAARSADGRGPRTVLEKLVPAHFGFTTPAELGLALHRNELDGDRIVELAPLLLAVGPDDAVAHALVERQAAEIVTLARVALERLDLAGTDVEIVLGGGLLRAEHADLVAAIRRDLEPVAPHAQLRVATHPPIVGAALLGLDLLGADDAARDRVRDELSAAALPR